MENDKSQLEVEYELTGNLALAMVEHAYRSIGPEGTVIKVPEQLAPAIREDYIHQLAETAIQLLSPRGPQDSAE